MADTNGDFIVGRPMIFINECLSDDAISTIGYMVNHHGAKNFKEVRDLILGYDQKNKSFKTLYGEKLSKMGTALITREKRVKDTEYFNKSGMIFYDGDIYENPNLRIDESCRRVLDVLFTISKNVIDYKYIIDTIIVEWNEQNIKDSLLLNNVMSPGICGDLHWRQLEVRQNSWKSLKKIARQRGLSIRDAFKLAIIKFLEDRSDMIKKECECD